MSDYATKIEHDNIECKHHMASNCILYKFNNIGTLPMSFKYIDVPDYISGETSITIKNSDIDRLDNIAYKYYGNPELFWIIMSVNNIINPFDIEIGTVLRILPKEYIEYKILRYNEDI